MKPEEKRMTKNSIVRANGGVVMCVLFVGGRLSVEAKTRVQVALRIQLLRNVVIF